MIHRSFHSFSYCQAKVFKTTRNFTTSKCTLWVFFRGLFLFTNFDSHLLSLATWNFNFLFDGQRVFGIWEWADLSWSSAPSSFGDFWEKQCHATFTKFRCLHCASLKLFPTDHFSNNFSPMIIVEKGSIFIPAPSLWIMIIKNMIIMKSE